MSTEMDDRIRRAFADVFEAVPELGPPPSPLERPDRSEGSSVKSSLLVAAAALILFAGLAALFVIPRSRDVAEPIASSVTTVAPPRTAIGDFVWPAPARDYSSFEELTNAFATEVLLWSVEDVQVDGATTTELSPQAFSLINTRLEREVTLLAIPSPSGWGFVQIGSPLDARVSGQSAIVVTFPTLPGTTSSQIEVRFTDGSTVVDTTTETSFEILEDRKLETLVSALILHNDASGAVVGATGGQFTSTDATPAPLATAPIESLLPECAPDNVIVSTWDASVRFHEQPEQAFAVAFQVLVEHAEADGRTAVPADGWREASAGAFTTYAFERDGHRSAVIRIRSDSDGYRPTDLVECALGGSSGVPTTTIGNLSGE